MNYQHADYVRDHIKYSWGFVRGGGDIISIFFLEIFEDLPKLKPPKFSCSICWQTCTFEIYFFQTFFKICERDRNYNIVSWIACYIFKWIFTHIQQEN